MWVTQKEHPTHQSALSVLPGFGTLTLGNQRHFMGISGLRGGAGKKGMEVGESIAVEKVLQVKQRSEQESNLPQDT